MTFRERLHAEFSPYGALTEGQLERLQHHYELLLLWNQRLNLTRITDLGEAVRFHYCESLFLGSKLPKGPLNVADLGSGAGFPGVPVGILRPDLTVTLVESDARKSVFLREVVRGMHNLNVMTARFQDVNARFDWAIARAVSPKEVLRSSVAPNFALLVSSSSVEPGSQVLRLPWGRDRVLMMVSRETSS